MEIALYIFLGWMFIYWLPNLAILVWVVRKSQDIDVKDFCQMMLVTALLGPLVGISSVIEYLNEQKAFSKVVFKKCTKREVWEALGGKD